MGPVKWFLSDVRGSEEWYYAATEVPQRILQRFHNLRAQNYLICPLVELAMAAPFLTPELRSILKGRNIQGANCIAMKGYSSAPDLARIASVIHLHIAQLQARWWISIVASSPNPADAPSRGDFTEHL